jgi:hypothetical protein
VRQVNESQAAKAEDLAERLSECTDEQIKWILSRISRLDFDRIRRIANWLTHRRDGQ